jgi:hypothetical protein
MHTRTPRRTFASPSLYLTATLFVLLAVFVGVAQTVPCEIPPRNPQNSAWPPGQTVNVYINPAGFTSQQIGAIQTALNNWSAGNNNAVNFNISTTPVSGNYSYTIRRQTPGISPGAQGETGGTGVTNGYRLTAYSNLNPGVTDITALTQVMSHEIGHTFGLGDCASCSQNSTAMTLPASADLNARGGSEGPTPCDSIATEQITPPNPCRPTTCGSRYQFDPDTCRCVYAWEYTGEHAACPVIIDVEGNGFSMTDAEGGVFFDFDNNKLLEKLSWTAAGSDDAWLVLDRNGNFRIDGGAELFGYSTPQPAPPAGEMRNGFLALAVYDLPANGGDGNGVIDKRDAVFANLLLWQDENHNAVSEPWELHTLQQLGLVSVSLDYKPSKIVDQYGNEFSIRSKITDDKHKSMTRWAWDVMLQFGVSDEHEYGDTAP